ncbi:MAG: RNA methyltransferase [Ferruginibacter sp.]
MSFLPTALLSSLKSIEGFDEPAFVAVHDSGEQIISVRLNPDKKVSNTLPIANNVLWSSNGYYLFERPIFTLDPLLHAGAYYVQEASSMFLEEALKQSVDISQPLKVLDLCAAPGGKSTLLQSIISPESLLVSNEVIKARVNILAENITKWGAANVVVTNNDPAHFKRLENYFDVIVVDAPCSGSGLFRKDPEAIKEWSLNNVQLCSQRQQRILSDILPSLKEGGKLIYSTCSYSVEEDEDIMNWLKQKFPLENVKLEINKDFGIVETHADGNSGYRFYPDKIKGEGFFIAVFQKKITDILSDRKIKAKAKSTDQVNKNDIETIRPFVNNVDELFFIKQADEIIALPLQLKDELPVLQSALYIKKAGIKIGSIIRNELLPDHELALSNIINPDVISIEVDKTTALQYLRKEEIKIETTVKGWALIKYNGLPLGWIKILPNRSNNYYPKEWRILMKS